MMFFNCFKHQYLSPIAATSIDGEWKAGIGDPTFMGWLTVCAYLATFILCLICAKETFRIPEKYQLHYYHWFWWGLALIFLFLGINKQLDLQTWFTITAKKMALSEGWYGDRRLFQALFIGWLIFGLLGLLAWFKKSFGTIWKEFRFILYGLAFLSAFIVVRATSFHHVDQLLHLNIVGFKMNWILELSGIGLVAFGAIQSLNTLRQLHLDIEALNGDF